MRWTNSKHWGGVVSPASPQIYVLAFMDDGCRTVDCICFFNVCDRVCWMLCSVVRRTSRWPCCCSSAQRATTSRTPLPSSTTSTTGSTCWMTLWVTRLNRQPHCTSEPLLSHAFQPSEKNELAFLNMFFSDSLFRARSPTNGRSHPPGVFCLGVASLQRCSDPCTFSFLSIFSP